MPPPPLRLSASPPLRLSASPPLLRLSEDAQASADSLTRIDRPLEFPMRHSGASERNSPRPARCLHSVKIRSQRVRDMDPYASDVVQQDLLSSGQRRNRFGVATEKDARCV